MLVHGDQHYLIQNHAISCAAVPMFGPAQRLLGVLNATACTHDAQKFGQALAYRLTLQTAARIEQSVFMAHYSDHWIARVKRQLDDWEAEPDELIAFDDGGRVVGASWRLKQRLGEQERRLEDILDSSVESLIDFACAHPAPPEGGRQRWRGGAFVQVNAPGARLRAHRRAWLQRSRSAKAPTQANRPRTFVASSGCSTQRCRSCCSARRAPAKEYMAKSIHRRSRRCEQPFVAINCAAIPETLIESELFGYREGRLPERG